MKKFIVFLTVFTASFALSGQTYQPWSPTAGMGPLTFNRITGPYVKTKYMQSSGGWYGGGYETLEGIKQYPNGMASHSLITQQGDDHCRCLEVSNNIVIYQKKLLPSWSGVPDEYLDTVVKIGCESEDYCTYDYTIEYWFYPQPGNSVLLFYFSFAEEDVPHHPSHLVNGSSPTACGCNNPYINPRFYIEVLDGVTEQPLQLGYYKNKNGTINTSWPYSRFMVTPDGCSSCQTSTETDNSGVTTYYWSCPEATPTSFGLRKCPKQYTNGHSPYYDVGWFEEKPLAFDLSSYANQNENGDVKSVKLRVRAEACGAKAHWSYCIFSATMMPANIDVDACGNDPIRLSVPRGMDELTYKWYYGYDSLDACNKRLNIGMTPGVTGDVYEVELDRTQATIYPYYRCEMKSYTGVPFVYEAQIKSYTLDAGFDYTQKFGNCDLSAKFQDTSHIYIVTPPIMQGGLPQTIQQETQNITWYVKKNGSFVQFAQNTTTPELVFDQETISADGEATIKIVIHDSLFKCVDSVEKVIKLDTSAMKAVNGVDTVRTCQEKLPYVYDAATFGTDYSWMAEGTRSVVYPGAAWNGCDSIVKVTMIVENPEVKITQQQDFCDEFRTVLVATTEDEDPQFTWSTGETTSSIEVLIPGKYEVTMVNDKGCETTDQEVVNSCVPYLNFPNTIVTQSEHEKNKWFYIQQTNLIKELEFSVYNRYGTVVFHTNDKNFRWDGKVDDKWFIGATYFYVLSVTDLDGVRSIRRGSVTIL